MRPSCEVSKNFLNSVVGKRNSHFCIITYCYLHMKCFCVLCTDCDDWEVLCEECAVWRVCWWKSVLSGTIIYWRTYTVSVLWECETVVIRGVAEKKWAWFSFNHEFYSFSQIKVYLLQSSSLGQLHSDGGIVSIVSSSAGRLLLVYLSARRLRSSGYYPKYQNGALASGFWAGWIKRSHRDWDLANRGLRNHMNAFYCQKFIDGDCRVTWDVIVVQHPSAYIAWSHTCHLFRESFKDFQI